MLVERAIAATRRFSTCAISSPTASSNTSPTASQQLLSTLIPPHLITHCLIQYTTLVCLHINADNNALTQALHTLMLLNFGIAKADMQ